MSADSNRARFPTVAAIVDELRAQGLNPRVLWAKEGPYEVGQRPEHPNAFDIPRGYRMSTVKERQ
jgi:hypothetical protein